MKMKNFVALALAGCMALSLAACGSTATTGETSEAATGEQAADATEATDATATGSGFTVQLGPNPETLDPALNSAIDGANTIITIFEPLLLVDENNEVVGGQAESWEVSEDGLVWTFTLRDGLKWSDGTDLTAKDFEYSFKRLADPNTAAPYGQTVVGMIAGYDDAVGNPDADGNMTTEPDFDALQVVASEDGKTLTVTLSYPCSYFDKIAAFASMSPVQQATIEANGDGWCTQPETFVCNGPYMITEWTPSERIVLSKNPNYVGGWDSSRIVSDTITLLLIEDDTAAYAAYNSGEAQLIKSVPSDEIPSLTPAEEGGDFYIDSNLGTYYISVNCQREPFTDPLVRKALSLAIDREYVADVVMQGTYSAAHGISCPGITDADGSQFADNANGGEPYIGNDYDANLEEAKALMAEAGYPDGEGFPTVTYSTNDQAYHLPLAEYLQSAWAELGITVNIDTPSSGPASPRCAAPVTMTSAATAGSWTTMILPTCWNCSRPATATTTASTATPEFDAAIEASKVADKATHYEQLHKAEDILMEDHGAASPLRTTTTSGCRARPCRAPGTAPTATGTCSTATWSNSAQRV